MRGLGPYWSTHLVTGRTCRCRLALNVDVDDIVHMLKTDTSIDWLPQLNL
jgi:hypothetical protein